MNFNDCCPGGTCTDLSAYSNHGTTHGGVGCADGVPGFTGKALYFDGSGYINCGNKPSLNITNAITIEAWVKSTYDGDVHTPIVNKGAYPFHMVYLNLRLGILQWMVGYGTGYENIYGDNLADGKWHHVVGIVGEKRNLKLYQDGKLRNSLTLPADFDASGINAGNLTIGYGTSGGYFKGTIDEVRIYNRALIAMEIQKHYVEGLKRHQSLVMDSDRD